MTAPANATQALSAVDFGSARRTVRALMASALGVLPLCELFTDLRWVLEVWLAMLIAVGPAAVLRCWHPPRVLHTWLGLGLVVVWLTARYVPGHALGGLLPTFATRHDVSALMSDVHDTTRNGVAPVHTTLAVTFVLAAVFALLAALVDLVAVVGRRGALAGVPLLIVYTVSGAVPRHPVSWLLFIGAAAGFLLLLSIDADDELRGWGRIITRQGDTHPSAGLSVSGPRIAAIALVVAVIVPLLAPSRPANLISDALRNGNSSGGGQGGFGTNGGVSLDPFDALKGDLQRPRPVKLFTVTLDPATDAQPFYLRANVLSTYSDKGWSAAKHGGSESIRSSFFETTPPSSAGGDAVTYAARLRIFALADNPPVFGRPVSITGLDGADWSRDDQLVIGTRVRNGQEFTEDVTQPAPSPQQLNAAAGPLPGDLVPTLRVPATMPKLVSDLVKRLTVRRTTPYAKARALNDYFTNPASGFTYSLSTKVGDSGSDLVDFLTNKAGFCQQYAAAMAIMLRMAGVPARVVLGYTHPAPDQDNRFSVTTNDAHAWVEAYFNGVGWIPFDPTPNAGLNGGSKANLPWAPHPQQTQTGAGNPSAEASASNLKRAGVQTAEGSTPTRATHKASLDLWSIVGGVLAIVVLLALVPGAIRWRRRRGRLRAAGGGDPDPLWAELSDTAVDLGYVWSPARSPRQVAGWLGRHVDPPAAQALATLASAVEVARYAPHDRARTTSLVEELRTVEARLRNERSRSVRIGARLLPASLGWRRVNLVGPRRRRR
ncbi:MAG: DUF3488 and DUF4129 domain-containing transglutaminase family protein [Jatrophihabitantaceae bacterium]